MGREGRLYGLADWRDDQGVYEVEEVGFWELLKPLRALLAFFRISLLIGSPIKATNRSLRASLVSVFEFFEISSRIHSYSLALLWQFFLADLTSPSRSEMASSGSNLDFSMVL